MLLRLPEYYILPPLNGIRPRILITLNAQEQSQLVLPTKPHTCCEQFRLLLAHARLRFPSRFPLGLMGPPHLDATEVLRLITRTDLTRTTPRTRLEDAVTLAGQQLLRILTLQIPQEFSQHWFIQNVMYPALGLEMVPANFYLPKSLHPPEQTKSTLGYHSLWYQTT